MADNVSIRGGTTGGTIGVWADEVSHGGSNVYVQGVTLLPGDGQDESLAKREDAAHASGDAGFMILGVRDDTVSADATDGDYMAFKLDSLGRLYTNAAITSGTVAITGTVPISGTVGVSGTVPVSGTFSGGTIAMLQAGTVAITGTVPVSGTFSGGTVAISGTVPVSVPGTVTATIATMPASSFGTDSVSEYAAFGTVIYGGTIAVQVRGTWANVAASANGTLVAGSTGNRIVMLGAVFNARGTTSFTINNGGSVWSPTYDIEQYGGMVWPPAPEVAYWESTAGSALVIANGSGGTIGALVRYAFIP